jgi:hypothetical protein
MKLPAFTHYFAPEDFRIIDLVPGMAARGHAVTVLTGQSNYPSGQFFEGHGWSGPRHEERFGAQIIRLPFISRGSASGVLLALNYLSFVIAGCRGVLARVRGPFDAIFVFEVSTAKVGVTAVLMNWKFRIPMFF